MPASSYFSGLFGLGAGNPTPTVPLNSLMAPTPNDPSTTPLRGLLGALQDPQFRSDVGNGLLGPLVRAKNQAVGLLTDPIGNVKQTMDSFGQSVDRQRALMDLAFADPKNPLQITSPTALGEAANNMLTGPLGFAPVGMTAYQGSPHVFKQFDASKIGTGEGAQAYGYGHYLAESPQVGKRYAIDITASRTSAAQRALDSAGGSVDDALSKVRSEIDRLQSLPNKGGDPDRWARQMSLQQEKLTELNNVKSGNGMSQGNLYTVDLHDSAVPNLLDWDKPLSQQHPNVQGALNNYAALGGAPKLTADMTGKQIYEAFAAKAARAKDYSPSEYGKAARAAADELRWAGLPGIRYLDQGSRGVGAGTSNFVVFPGNEHLLTIMERTPVR